jgi:beta-glucosidase
VVQLYVSHPGAAAPAPLRSLQGFRRLHLRAGESRRVEFQLAPGNLGLIDAAGRLSQGTGTIVIHVGGGQPGYAATVSARVRITDNRHIIH